MWRLIKGKQPNSSAKSMRTATTVTPGEGSSCHRFVLIEIWRETWKNYNCFSRLLCLTRHLHWDSGLTHPTNDVFLLHPPSLFPTTLLSLFSQICLRYACHSNTHTGPVDGFSKPRFSRSLALHPPTFSDRLVSPVTAHTKTSSRALNCGAD